MSENLLQQLNSFIVQASKATYAGGGDKVKPWRPGFQELDYTEDDWYYRDSYCGFLRSWGQEVIWYEGSPLWTCLYGGGMADDCMEEKFAHETFTFLKQVLGAGNKEGTFQPRGPKEFITGKWSYSCALDGSIGKFSGHESIMCNGKIVFIHDFAGGLVIGAEK